MDRQAWGTYSIRDHLWEHPWAADVMLYDRLVIPVPAPRNSPEGPDEWTQWKAKGLDPGRQETLLSVLGERAVPVWWDSSLTRWDANLLGEPLGLAQHIGWETEIALQGIRITGSLLDYPWMHRPTTPVTTVATYRSATNLMAAMELRNLGEHDPFPPGQMVVIVGREFLAPDPGEFRSDLDLLRAALAIEDAEVRDRRAAYWRWQHEVLREGLFVDQESVTAAVEEMQDLIADEQRAVRRSHARLVTLFALAAFNIGAGTHAGPRMALTSDQAFLSVGQFTMSREFAASTFDVPSPVGLLITDHKEFGWH